MRKVPIMTTETLNDRTDDPAFETSLETGVLYEASLSEVWRLATGSSYGDHYNPDDMAQYVLVRVPSEDGDGEELWMLDTQAIDRDHDPALAAAISQDGIIEATAARSTISHQFVMECQYRHHYRKCLRITGEADERPFRRLARLSEWCYATEDEAKEATMTDPDSVITGISLFAYHGWQWQTGKRGIAIMKK